MSEKPQRLPPWIRTSLQTDKGFVKVHHLVDSLHLHTVCEEARCPNRHECWNSGTATVMILGDVCTRSCGFCSVKSGRPPAVDTKEPARVAASAEQMDLKHMVITSVDRDDLEDGGAGIFAETIREVKQRLPQCNVEVLTPDFEGNIDSLNAVLEAAPEVFSHNIETVKRLQAQIRPQANYGRSLSTLRHAAGWGQGVLVKSGIMVGLGETEEEVIEAIADLYAAGTRILAIGQYLRPTRDYVAVERYVEPAEFQRYEEAARAMGFPAVFSGPMVRSSYRADVLYEEALGATA